MLNLDTMPNEAYKKPEEGVYVFKITRCELVTSKDKGSKMIQFDYIAVDNADVKVNYDNCPYMDKDGNGINFGLAKLKRIIKATKTVIAGDFEPKILPKLLIGKTLMFKADYNGGKSKYLQLSDIDSITSPIENIQNATPEMFMVEEPTSPLRADEKKPTVEIKEQDWDL